MHSKLKIINGIFMTMISQPTWTSLTINRLLWITDFGQTHHCHGLFFNLLFIFL